MKLYRPNIEQVGFLSLITLTILFIIWASWMTVTITNKADISETYTSEIIRANNVIHDELLIIQEQVSLNAKKIDRLFAIYERDKRALVE